MADIYPSLTHENWKNIFSDTNINIAKIISTIQNKWAINMSFWLAITESPNLTIESAQIPPSKFWSKQIEIILDVGKDNMGNKAGNGCLINS